MLRLPWGLLIKKCFIKTLFSIRGVYWCLCKEIYFDSNENWPVVLDRTEVRTSALFYFLPFRVFFEVPTFYMDCGIHQAQTSTSDSSWALFQVRLRDLFQDCIQEAYSLNRCFDSSLWNSCDVRPFRYPLHRTYTCNIHTCFGEESWLYLLPNMPWGILVDDCPLTSELLYGRSTCERVTVQCEMLQLRQWRSGDAPKW